MANQSSNYIVIGAPAQANVTVSPSVRQPPPVRQVLVTPLSRSQQPHQLMSTQSIVNPPIKMVMLKAVNRGNKGKEPKTFTLRDVRPEANTSCAAVKRLIKAQLSQDITEDDFDIGYLQGNTVVSIRSKADLELWEGLRKGFNTTMWCDGMNGPAAQNSSLGRKRSTQDDEEAQKNKEKKKKKKDDESKEEKVEKNIQTLQGKHGKEFTPMQYRIWAEMHVGGYQPSLDEAPSNSMFLRAGGAATKRTTADIVSQAINQLTPVLSPGVAAPTSHSSPAKLINNRSKCYKQLGELKNLMQTGILSDEEYSREREAIMGTLKSLGQ